MIGSAASTCFDRSGPSDDLSRARFSSRWSCYWCHLDLTMMAMRPLVVCLVMSWTDFSQSWMLQHGSYSQEEARSCNATTAWSLLAAGATAYWIQDCCACLPVSSRTSSGVSVCRATECEGSTIKGRQRLRSSSSHFLVVPTSRLSTVGDRAFPVSAERVWNTLSRDSRCHLSQLFAKLLNVGWRRSSFYIAFRKFAPTASD